MGVIQKIAVNNNGSATTHTIAASTMGVCSTAAATAAKTTTITDLNITDGLTIAISFTNGNSAESPTLSINSGTAYPISNLGTRNAGDAVLLTFSGSKWHVAGGSSSEAYYIDLTNPSGTLTATQYNNLLNNNDSYITYASTVIFRKASSNSNGANFIATSKNGSLSIITIKASGSTYTYETTTFTSVTLDTQQTFTGLKTFNDTGSGAIGLKYNSGTYTTFLHAPSDTLSANLDVRLPAKSGTVALTTDIKVKDVTLGGTSIVNSDGVVELQKTSMTDNYIPVWNNTSGSFENGVTAEGTVGYVLTAQGSGKKPTWTSIKSISSITVTKV